MTGENEMERVMWLPHVHIVGYGIQFCVGPTERLDSATVFFSDGNLGRVFFQCYIDGRTEPFSTAHRAEDRALPGIHALIEKLNYALAKLKAVAARRQQQLAELHAEAEHILEEGSLP